MLQRIIRVNLGGYCSGQNVELSKLAQFYLPNDEFYDWWKNNMRCDLRMVSRHPAPHAK
jgi:hypothetical protein